MPPQTMTTKQAARQFPGARLHVVSGKGGTGKTTVAAALALSLARGGRRVLLAEVEDRQGLARMFDTAPLTYEERTLAVAEDNGEVFGLAVEPRAAFMEYLEKFYRAGPVAALLRRTGAVDFVTTIAPGLRDVLLTGKIWESSKRRRSPRKGEPFAYDAVVLDAPPTGRIGNFLNVNAEVSGLAKVGPIHQQASSVTAWLKSENTVVHLVTLLEEMPVQETQDAAAEIQQIGIPLGCIIVNQVPDKALDALTEPAATADQFDRDEIMAGLLDSGVIRSGNEHTARSQGILASLLDQAASHARRARLQQDNRVRLREVAMPTVDLPFLADGVNTGGLFLLADRLAEEGLRA